jgi:hypothetical protein
MRKVKLNWFSAQPVTVLFEGLRSVEYFRNPDFPELNNYGLYMFLDKDRGKARYIGQALDLKKRVRWEIVKDGNGCAESAFYLKCKKYNVNRFNLLLKVAHLKNPQKDGINVNEVADEFMNAVERALIFERARAGDPLMNETGKSSYRLGPTEIINCGDFTPLPASIVLK